MEENKNTKLVKINTKYKHNQDIVIKDCVFLGTSGLDQYVEIDANKVTITGLTLASHEIGSKLLNLLTLWENFVTAPKRFVGWIKSKFTKKSKVIVSK
jgi:hypothetical protein